LTTERKETINTSDFLLLLAQHFSSYVQHDLSGEGKVKNLQKKDDDTYLSR